MAKDCFTYPFKTNRNYYLYDVNSNSILRINSEMWEWFNNKSEAISEENCKILNKMKSDGFLKSNPIKDIHHATTDILDTLLQRKLMGMTFQVTQQCNLRCQYCIYSDTGGYTQRRHAPKRMSLELAKKGVDFALPRSVDTTDILFGFYGGEPLLEFTLIKHIVAYAEKKFSGKSIRFNMTTNGTLFTDEILDFISEHQFMITISLDGPQHIHDQNRRFAINNQGSYSTIMKNVAYIREKYPHLIPKLTFNAVVDPSQPQSCTNEFFYTCKDLIGFEISAGPISDEYHDTPSKPSEEFMTSEEVERFKAMMSKLGRIDNKRVSRITEAKFSEFKKDAFIQRPRMEELGEVNHHGGPCIPGVVKLFMNTDGKLYPCEKVSEASTQTCIGTIDTGFDLNQVARIMDLGKLTQDECKNCWCIRLCKICVLFVDNLTELSVEKKIHQCSNMRFTVLQTLRDFCMMNEMGYKFEKSNLAVYGYGD